jgi:hypothetical protein
VETYKEDIIRQKMDTLFGYMGEKRTSKLFEEQLLAYQKTSEQVKDLLTKQEEMYFNPVVNELIRLKRSEIQIWIQEVKRALIDNDIPRATEIQSKEILPRAQYIRRKMYGEMSMDYNKKKGEHRLIQSIVPAFKLEELLSETPSVIQFGKD